MGGVKKLMMSREAEGEGAAGGGVGELVALWGGEGGRGGEAKDTDI